MTERLQRQSEDLKKNFNDLLGEEKSNWDQDREQANEQYDPNCYEQSVWKQCLLYNEVNFLIKYGIFDSYIYGFLKTTKNSIDRLIYIINDELIPTFGKSYNYEKTVALLNHFVAQYIIDYI